MSLGNVAIATRSKRHGIANTKQITTSETYIKKRTEEIGLPGFHCDGTRSSKHDNSRTQLLQCLLSLLYYLIRHTPWKPSKPIWMLTAPPSPGSFFPKPPPPNERTNKQTTERTNEGFGSSNHTVRTNGRTDGWLNRRRLQFVDTNGKKLRSLCFRKSWSSRGRNQNVYTIMLKVVMVRR